MAREKIAIDGWASYISPEGATKWPAEFKHIFNKYKSPKHMTEGQSVQDLAVTKEIYKKLVRDNVINALKLDL